ncbi:MAG: hypothetical protein JNJ48_01490 [Phycisphaerae bacterium]|nr:hypothetical protein [Phycisphaerae bacterium]
MRLHAASIWFLVVCYGVLAPLCCCARAAVMPVHAPIADRGHASEFEQDQRHDCCSTSEGRSQDDSSDPADPRPAPSHDCDPDSKHCDQCKAPQALGTVGDSADLSLWLLPVLQPAHADAAFEAVAARSTVAAPPPGCCPTPRSGRGTLLTLCRLSI